MLIKQARQTKTRGPSQKNLQIVMVSFLLRQNPSKRVKHKVQDSKDFQITRFFMVHHLALPPELSPYSAFQKKLSDKEVNGDEAQLMQEL